MLKLYDEIIEKWMQLAACGDAHTLTPDGSWSEVTDRSMILRSEMAYELGGEGLEAIGSTVITTRDDLVPEDSVILLGKDLGEIKEDTPYARLSIVRVDENEIGEGDNLYSAVRNLEYTRYHHYPQGFMMRISSSRNRECVRVAKKAVSDGISFSHTGSLLIKDFHKSPVVRAVKVIYITDADFDFRTLATTVRDAEGITKTIDHIFRNVKMDCTVCSLQKICDEVEGLKELHFSRENAN